MGGGYWAPRGGASAATLWVALALPSFGGCGGESTCIAGMCSAVVPPMDGGRTDAGRDGGDTADAGSDGGLDIVDGGGGGGDDSGSDTALVLRSAPDDCRAREVLYPGSPATHGFWAAQRFDPQPTAYTIERIDYRLHAGEFAGGAIILDGTLAHSVQLFRATADRPASNPMGVRAVTVDALDAEPLLPRSRTLDLTGEPYEVEADEYVYVAIEMVASGGATLGLPVCFEASPEAAFWSRSTGPPYDWVTLSTVGFSGAGAMRIEGRVELR